MRCKRKESLGEDFFPFDYLLHYRWQDRSKDKKIIYCLGPAEVAGDLPNAEATAQQQHGDIAVFVLGQGDGRASMAHCQINKTASPKTVLWHGEQLLAR